MRHIVVTHFHPDHVGAAADLAELTGAPVAQGRLDYEQCELVWDAEDWGEVLASWFRRHGVPDDVTDELVEQGSLYRPFVRFQRDPERLEPGDEIGGWQVVAAPGHADGQLMLLRDGVLVAADHLLGRITPTVGLWPASRPDPLGDYLKRSRRRPRSRLEWLCQGTGTCSATPRDAPRADRAPSSKARCNGGRARQRAPQRLRGVLSALW